MKFANQLSFFALVVLVCLICYTTAQDKVPSALVDLGTPDDDLVDAALEHEEVADKCQDIVQRILLAQASGAPINSKIQKKLDSCMKYLDNLEEIIEVLTDQIINGDE